MQNKKTINITKPIASIITCLVLAVILITSVSLIAFTSDKYYEHEFRKYNVLADVNSDLSMDEAVLVLSNTNKYLKSDSDKLSAKVCLNGTSADFFSQRERHHLKDVRKLISNSFTLRNIFAGIIAIYLLWFTFRGKKRAREISLTFIATSIFVNAFAAVAAFIISLDFDKWFIKFHQVLFDNNDWLLNPNQDNLINLLPEEFFMDTVLYSLVVYAAAVTLLIVFNILMYKRSGKAKN